MNQWVNVTDTFSESQRHYKNTYLEIYFSFGIMYGIVYAEKENAYERREQMKADLEKEYCKNKEPSNEFIDSFAKKFDVCLPGDVLFDEDALMDAFMKI